MSMEQYYQQITEFTRTENYRNFSSINPDSSSDDEPAPKKKRMVSNLVLPGRNGEASDSSAGAIAVKSSKAIPVNVQEKNKYRKRKSNTKKSSRKSSGKKNREFSSRISAAIDDFEKFTKSIIDELKVDYQKMLEQFKKDLANLEAPYSILKTTDNKGKRILNSTSHAHEQKCTYSEPQLVQPLNASSSRNFIPPSGQFAGNTGFTYRRESLMPNPVNRRGYFTNLLAQVSFPNSVAVEPEDLSYLRRNSVQTSGIGYSGLPLSLHQRLANISYIPHQTAAGNSSRVNTLGWNMNGRPTMFHGSGHALSNSVPANHFRATNFYDNLQANEAWQRMHGRHNGSFQ